jgi:beta-glucosidase
MRAFALTILAATSLAAQDARPVYKDPAQPIEMRVRDLLGRMTLQEKFFQLYMSPGDRDDVANDWSKGAFGLQIEAKKQPAGTDRRSVVLEHTKRVNAIQRYFVDSTRLGIPIIPFDEAAHGLMRDGATVFPAAIGLAATWDTLLMSRTAQYIAAETRARGIRQVLSPVINIANDVRWGRVEETYGEDPFLSGVMARAYVRAFERSPGGATDAVIATPKHFVANVGDGGRDSHPISFDRRTLDEVHFPPFVESFKAGARSVMTAYNSVDGVPATQNRWLLTDVLRRQWGFSGFTISDAAATGGATVLHFTERNTPEAAKHAWEAGLDVVFQSTWAQHRPYLQAVEQGLVSMAVIDTAVSRVLRAKFQLGLFEKPTLPDDIAVQVMSTSSGPTRALETAEKSLVLLRNERGTLPFGPRVKRVAVIGEDAREARLGGYTASGATGISIEAALVHRVGAASVKFAPGPGRVAREYAVVPESALVTDSAGAAVFGLRGEYWSNPDFRGAPALTRRDRAVNFGWTLSSPGRGVPYDWYAARWTGRMRVPAGGVRRIGVEGNDGWRLWIDGKLVLDNWKKESYGARLANVTLAPRSSHEVKLEFHERAGNARVKLIWDGGVRNDWRAKIDSAVKIARLSDAAVVAVGIEEGEFRDRSTLALGGHQEELIEAVAATGKPTVVVLVGGSAITGGKWLERSGALLDAWYPGELGGTAIVKALYGEVNPAGRLPITFPMRDGQLPLTYNHKPTGRGDDYVDGTGMALFPFGHGLSYTTFEYSDLVITPDTIGAAATATVTLNVKNAGSRIGDEVVQLYIRDLLATVARPVIQLAGFTRLSLAPGETKSLSFILGPDQLSLVDRDLNRIVEPGQFRIMVGASSKDIRLRGFLTVR